MRLLLLFLYFLFSLNVIPAEETPLALDLQKERELQIELGSRLKDISLSASVAITEIARIQKELSQAQTLPSTASLSLIAAESLHLKLSAEASDLSQQLAELEREIKRQTERRIRLPKLLTDLRQNLEALNQKNPSGNSSDPLLKDLKRQNLIAEIALLERETQTYDLRFELLRAKKSLIARKASLSDDAGNKVAFHILNLRQKDLDSALNRTKTDLDSFTHPLVHQLARENHELVQARIAENGVLKKIALCHQELENLQQYLKRLKEKESILQEKVKAVGMTSLIGLLMHQISKDLPSIRSHRLSHNQRQEQIASAQLKKIELEERERVTEIAWSNVLPDEKLLMAPLLEQRKKFSKALLDDWNTYFYRLIDLDALEVELIQKTESLQIYLEEHILWVRSTKPLYEQNLKQFRDAFLWLGSLNHWRECAETLHPLQGGGLIWIAAVLLFGLKHSLQKRGFSFFASLCLPLLPILMHYPIAKQEQDFSQAFGTALLALGLVWMLCRLYPLHQISQFFLLAFTFLYTLLASQAVMSHFDSFGRLIFLALVLLIVHESRGLRFQWKSGVAFFSLFLAILTIAGYQYTSEKLLLQAGYTLCFALICQFSLSHLRQKLHRYEPLIAEKQLLPLLKAWGLFLVLLGLFFLWRDFLPALAFLQKIDLYSTIQVQTLIQTMADGSLQTKSASYLHPVSLGSLLLALLVLFLTGIACRDFPRILSAFVSRLDSGQQYALNSLVYYLILILGICSSAYLLGLSWDKVHWLVAAFTVGLGFGLQEIFANFMAGIIILFERPFRIGDTVTIGGTSGVVQKIHIRATILNDADRRELIIPNKKFLTEPLVNWTLSDKITRVCLTVKTNRQESFPVLKETILNSIRNLSHQPPPLVLKNPEPEIVLLNLSAEFWEVELSFYVSDVTSIARIRGIVLETISHDCDLSGIHLH